MPPPVFFLALIVGIITVPLGIAYMIAGVLMLMAVLGDFKAKFGICA